MSKSVITIVLLLLYGICSGAVINVPSSEPTIQAGVDAALEGDTILVAADVYTGEGNRDIDFGGKNIVLMSESGAQSTIIDCEGWEAEPHRAFRLTGGEDTTSIIQGFTIENGYGPIEYGNFKGGAIYCHTSSVKVIDCIFNNNIGFHNGGAVATFASSPIFIGCEFYNNRAIHGGGVYFNGAIPKSDTPLSNPVLRDCIFDGNEARDYDGYGGAVYIQYDNVTLTMSNCLVINNSALYGGGYCGASTATANISSCTFADNSAPEGGNLCVDASCVTNIDYCIIAYSQLGAGFYDDGFISIQCTDIYGNAGGDWTGSIADLLDTDGNISADPMFCDPQNGNFHLNSASQCAPGNNECSELFGALEVNCSDYLCGDANSDAVANIADAIFIIGYIFSGGIGPDPIEAGDANCDNKVNIVDVVYIIHYVFQGGHEPCDLNGDGIPDC